MEAGYASSALISAGVATLPASFTLPSTASAGVAGMPRAKSGTKPPLVVALLAPSGAATPW